MVPNLAQTSTRPTTSEETYFGVQAAQGPTRLTLIHCAGGKLLVRLIPQHQQLGMLLRILPSRMWIYPWGQFMVLVWSNNLSRKERSKLLCPRTWQVLPEQVLLISLEHTTLHQSKNYKSIHSCSMRPRPIKVILFYVILIFIIWRINLVLMWSH